MKKRRQRVKENYMEELDKLLSIDRVEAPDHLYTRIKQRIENSRKEMASPAFLWVTAITLIFMISINAFTWTQTDETPDINLAESLGMLPSNSLYE